MKEGKNKNKKNKKIFNLKYGQILLPKYLIILLYVISCFNIFNSRNKNTIIFFNSNEIRLKVAGPGTYSIINSDFQNKISSIYLNKNSITINSQIQLSNSINDVKIIFSSSVTNCNSMFKECSKIIEIDISDFISSNLEYINNIFYDCISLKSITFGNFQTSNINNMKHVFYNCSSLETLDLPSFDTSSVSNFYSMFAFCRSMKFLDLSNFRTSSSICTIYMFYECSSITSINFSSFDSSRVTLMSYMFYN